jgi:hypothetical protein
MPETRTAQPGRFCWFENAAGVCSILKPTQR